MVAHYQELDPLYWSIVDIIDSILHARDDLAHMSAFRMALKSDLVVLLREDLAATTKLFHTYGYPGPHSKIHRHRAAFRHRSLM